MILEICAGNLQSAINAQRGGAQRIELCKDLHLDGLTPDRELIVEVRKALSIPIFVLIRPRPGNFVYTDSEFQQMLKQVVLAKELGCDGIVSGILTSEGAIDRLRMEQLIAQSAPLPFTFHRAFDHIIDQEKELETLISLGVDRILTSGGRQKAISALDRLKKLKAEAQGRLIIMPGGGVRPDDVGEFTKEGFTELHSSAVEKSDTAKEPDDVSNLGTIRRFIAEMPGI